MIRRPISVMDAMLADALMTDALTPRAGTTLRARGASCHSGARARAAPDGAYSISLEAPGVAASDVTIEVGDNGHITLRGATKTGHGFRRLDYSLAIPRGYDAEEATAEVADGLITLSVPQAAEPETHSIVVSSEPDETATETEEERPFTLTLVAAGIAPADLELTVKGGALKVHGRSKRTGASLGPRVYKLPRNADASRIAASQVDGILTVTVPTRAKSAPKRLEVNKRAPAPLPAPMETDVAAGEEALETTVEVGVTDAATDGAAADGAADNEAQHE